MRATRYGLTRTLIGAFFMPSSTSLMNSAGARSWMVEMSLSILVIELFACQLWSRNCASLTSRYAGIRCQKGPRTRSRCLRVEGSTGGFFATIGSAADERTFSGVVSMGVRFAFSHAPAARATSRAPTRHVSRSRALVAPRRRGERAPDLLGELGWLDDPRRVGVTEHPAAGLAEQSTRQRHREAHA